MKHIKRLIIIVPVMAGVALFGVMKAGKKPPVRVEGKEQVRAVRVMPLEKMPVTPRITGYGYVKSDKTWQAIPEVSGQVVVMDEKIKKGHFIKKGEVLLQIDTRALGLAESRGEAEVMGIDAQLKELEQSKKNTQRLLAIEEKSLAIAAQELERKRQLHEKQFISASDFEKEKTNFLARQSAVDSLTNTLNLIPAQESSLKALKRSGESSVAERRLDVSKTSIRAPFDGRISKVNVERFQYAPMGTVMLEAESIERAEIPVQLSPLEFFKLMPKDSTQAFDRMPDIEMIRQTFGVTAKVRLQLDKDHTIEWDGRFSRTGESIDPDTGTLTFFVFVDKPYANVIPGKRPPLATNMYVEVQLSGRVLPDRFVIPRSAVHKNAIYICTPDNRLEIRPIDIEFSMDELSVLTKGVSPGEILVLSDLVPAVGGMKLAPDTDTKTVQDIRQRAAGEAQ